MLVSLFTVAGSARPKVIYGDANDDIKVNMKDVLSTRKYTAYLLREINIQNSDVNVDKVVDMKDTLGIRKHLANNEDFDAVRIDSPQDIPYDTTISKKVWNADQSMIAAISKNHEGENFSFSPVSLNMALGMATLGAKGNTRKQLLDAYGMQDISELFAYTNSIMSSVEKFNQNRNEFILTNSVWNNVEETPIATKYSQGIEQYFKGSVHDVLPSEYANLANDWVKEKTKGKIDSIIDPNAVDKSWSVTLINTLFLNQRWNDVFESLGSRSFTTYSNQVVEKQFMFETVKAPYYESENCQLISIPLETEGLSVVFVLGDCDDIYSCMKNATQEAVGVTIPFVSIQSDFSSEELINELKAKGVVDAFLPEEACFTAMKEDNLYVSSIRQKTGFAIDQAGVTASAASAVGIAKGGVTRWEKEFCANRPFKIYLMMDNNEGAYSTLFYTEINQ